MHHELKEANRLKRFQRSPALYKKLANGRWKNIITSDEATFYLDGTYKTRPIQYISEGQEKSEIQIAPRRSHPKSIMVWVAFSSKGFLQPIFVPPQVKINYDYYIKYILKPLKKTGDELFGYGKWIFHQDSAPAHTAKKTVKFLKESKINVIKPSEWIPNSPDCAPCDFWLS